jgi:hypothetical protein
VPRRSATQYQSRRPSAAASAPTNGRIAGEARCGVFIPALFHCPPARQLRRDDDDEPRKTTHEEREREPRREHEPGEPATDERRRERLRRAEHVRDLRSRAELGVLVGHGRRRGRREDKLEERERGRRVHERAEEERRAERACACRGGREARRRAAHVLPTGHQRARKAAGGRGAHELELGLAAGGHAHGEHAVLAADGVVQAEEGLVRLHARVVALRVGADGEREAQRVARAKLDARERRCRRREPV